MSAYQDIEAVVTNSKVVPGCDITPIKSMLASLPNLYMSLFQMPIGGNITKPITLEGDEHRTLGEGIGYIIGEGKNVHFWAEEWIKWRIQKKDFLRIFALATIKEGKVKEFGVWVDGLWQWRIELRRMLFGWEKKQRENLLKVIMENPVISGYDDKRVIRGRVAVKAKLVKRRLLREDLALCMLCQEKRKQLIISSLNAKKVEKSELDKGIDGVYNGQRTQRRKVWDGKQCLDLVMARVTWWTKARWPEECHQTVEQSRNFDLDKAKIRNENKKEKMKWQPPKKGSLKFNVDGATRGMSGQATIGRVLRDEGGAIKVMFSKFIRIADANTTEVLAIREAFKIFGASKWVRSHVLIVESNSSNVVSWFHNLEKAP
ncbi:Ribonuclease H domain - like 10 [Theobroma cacao]|nr:Ribonuclease H domain - like 10 [Theobroma cacao]